MGINILFFSFFLSIALFLTPSVQAKVISSEEQVVVEEGEVIDDDLFVTAGDVTIKGIINGDLYVGGENIKISGIVNGDVLIVGGVIEITGEIEDDVRVAGGSINIQGASIGDSLTVAGGSVNIEKDSTVGGGLLFGAGSVNIGAEVGRGIMGGGGSVNISGSVGKDVYVGAEKLTLGPNIIVAGDLVYGSEKEVKLSETAIVSGKIRYLSPTRKKVTSEIAKPGLARVIGDKFRFAARLWSYLAALLVGSLALYFFKKPSEQIAGSLEKNWLSNLGHGFLLIIIALPVFIMLAITGIGLPLAMILSPLFLINLYLSKIVIGVFFGKKLETLLSKQKMNVYLSFASGLAIYYLLGALPILGGFVRLAALLLGLGALFSYQKTQLLKNRK